VSQAMDFTATTHPPAGATALLATSDDHVAAIGWLYIPIVLLSSIIVLCIALINNNVQVSIGALDECIIADPAAQRRYPAYWISPAMTPAAVAANNVEQPENRRSTDPLTTNAAKLRPDSMSNSSAEGHLADKV
jgi:CBS-domain-containing membrane protein